MYARLIHALMLLMAFCFGLCATASAGEHIPSQHELAILQLINQARVNPLEVAASVGLDAEQVLADLPDLHDILTQGLPPLWHNEDLYAAARAHTLDMAENGYYGHESLDGRTYDDRIVENGYVPVGSGEALGGLAFLNFVDAWEALEAIFKNMFMAELDPWRTESRNILNPDLKEVGVGFATGTLDVRGSHYNVYLVTCDFGTSAAQGDPEEAMARELLQLINQARAKPLEVAGSLGMHPDQVLADLPELCDILTAGLPPLGLNESLHRAARTHNHDMLANGYYAHDSLDGRTHEERIKESGYDAVVSGESLGMLDFATFVDPAEAVGRMFESMFLGELDPLGSEKRNILSPDFIEVGIGFSFGVLELDGLLTRVYLATCDFGAKATRNNAYLLGLVYGDLDGDGLYSPGEGRPGIPVFIDIPHQMLELLTDSTGGFGLRLGPGAARVIVELPGNTVESWVDLEQENARSELRID